MKEQNTTQKMTGSEAPKFEYKRPTMTDPSVLQSRSGGSSSGVKVSMRRPSSSSVSKSYMNRLTLQNGVYAAGYLALAISVLVMPDNMHKAASVVIGHSGPSWDLLTGFCLVDSLITI